MEYTYLVNYDYNCKQKWQLFNTEENERLVNSFDTQQELVDYLKTLTEEFSVWDDYIEGKVDFKNGKVVGIQGFGIIKEHIESSYDGLREVYMGMKKQKIDEEEYTVKCSRCGDGGCAHCDPGFFV